MARLSKGTVLDLIEQAEHEIQGTTRGAERKAWVAQMLRTALSASKWGRLISWAWDNKTYVLTADDFAGVSFTHGH